MKNILKKALITIISCLLLSTPVLANVITVSIEPDAIFDKNLYLSIEEGETDILSVSGYEDIIFEPVDNDTVELGEDGVLFGKKANTESIITTTITEENGTKHNITLTVKVIEKSENSQSADNPNIEKEWTDKDAIIIVQEELNANGFDCGTPDGIAGQKTKSAIKSYQKTNNMKATGVITDSLISDMGIAEKIRESKQTKQTEPSYTQEPEAPQYSSGGGMVWIPTHGGTKYHNNSSCSGMKDPRQVSKEEAIAMGFSACKKC